MLDRARLGGDLAYFAERCLTIRAKSGATQPLRFNAAQHALHAAAEAQRRATGRVRIAALKARQLGFSTYVQARFFHRAMHAPGQRAFIMTHAAPATANLFAMAARFQAGCPIEVRPPLSSETATSMGFAGLESSYRVGTARTGAVGRSDTIQLFHGSEVAFWPRAAEHIAGALQAVPSEAGTEVWLESTVTSTVNGPKTFFREACIKAIKGTSPFLFVFVPWFWNDAYRAPFADVHDTDKHGAARDQDEADLAARFDLDAGQLAWRREKIGEIGPEAFRHEYPASPEDALSVDHPAVAMHRRLIGAAVNRPATREAQAAAAPVWGLDPGRFVDDRPRLAKRFGDALLEPVAVLAASPPNRQATIAAVVTAYAGTPDRLRPRRIIVATTGSDNEVAAALRQAGLPAIDLAPGATARGDERFVRQRDALWWAARDWFTGRRCRIPDDTGLILDLSAPLRRVTPEGQIEMEATEETRARLGYAPDLAEAFVLTFADGV